MRGGRAAYFFYLCWFWGCGGWRRRGTGRPPLPPPLSPAAAFPPARDVKRRNVYTVYNDIWMGQTMMGNYGVLFPGGFLFWFCPIWNKEQPGAARQVKIFYKKEATQCAYGRQGERERRCVKTRPDFFSSFHFYNVNTFSFFLVCF